ncbi:MAG: hypothetical protein D8M58_18165 [Calditrichaeota bacterium]|nr:MAG: hypothetical protein DWQ03_11395 [Calditrichota bacterium]MBL1207335.1 hypothetical protein [Calditrichota bacterium]NOG47168.1 hypothetical protein [Calditrichota bacterium]
MNEIKSTFSITICPKLHFDFEATVTTHGWLSLAPFIWNAENAILSRVEQLNDGKLVRLNISATGSTENPTLSIEIHSTSIINEGNKQEVAKLVTHILRLDEDFEEFYQLCTQQNGTWNDIKKGKGRLLRSPTVFEDLVKTICTTNIQWGGTKRMAQELVDKYGQSFAENPTLKSFPKAEDIVSDSFEEFTQKVNLGYRADYIYQLAKNVSAGTINPEDFLDQQLSTIELKKKLLAIKGIGNYASATMLMLLGRYDELPIDSVFKDFVSGKYFNGKKYSEKKARNIYKKWGRWQYLAYWFDMEKS